MVAATSGGNKKWMKNKKKSGGKKAKKKGGGGGPMTMKGAPVKKPAVANNVPSGVVGVPSPTTDAADRKDTKDSRPHASPADSVYMTCLYISAHTVCNIN